ALERAFIRLYGEHDEAPPSHQAAVSEDATAAMDAPEPARSPERATDAVVLTEPHASGPAGVATPPPRDGERSRPGTALEAMRARMEPLRQLARSWERWTDTVETLLRERRERRDEIEGLASDLREARAALARATQELEIKTEAMA